MPFSLALQHIANAGSSSFVAYAQEQNDCFPFEYLALAPDVDSYIPWASEALRCLPEAVNLWWTTITPRHTSTRTATRPPMLLSPGRSISSSTLPPMSIGCTFANMSAIVKEIK
ncbi:hypothetical protein AAC387_Pa02g1865 [Persea americana]